MRAIVQSTYGSSDVLKLKNVENPVIKENEVLVRVLASAVNAGDYFSMTGSPWVVRMSVGFPKPKNYIPGWDVAGRVQSIGKNVKQFKPGDEVFAAISSAFAEYACVAEDQLAIKPANLSFEHAAAVPTAALTALQGLRDVGKIRAGQKVLINGAAGGVGTFAVQIAKTFGAEVAGVCSTRNVDMIRSIGAGHVFDYTKEDFAQSEQKYDLILDNVANRSFSELSRVLSPQGIIIPNSGHGGMRAVFIASLRSMVCKQQGGLFVTKSKQKDIVLLKELIEAGKVQPVIDSIYPLEKTPEAIEYLGKGHARGKVVITVAHETDDPQNSSG